jgi:pyruvate dehydrogenase (quinone)
VLEVVVDPDVPTIPPHITFKEMVNFSKMLLKGDAHEGGVIKQTFKDAVESLLPHKH